MAGKEAAMGRKKYVLALDEGTTSSRAILFDHEGTIVSVAQKEFPQIYPNPGWVEHDPVVIWENQLGVAREALKKAGAAADQVAGIGIADQRETTVIWDRATGKPVYNAIVWQDHRTADTCDQLKARGLTDYVRQTTGLVIDAYFSGTKIKWILDHVPGARQRAEKGELAFGTIDSWLIWNLTAGAVHVTDYSNASRTLLENIATVDWDERMLSELCIPRALLPKLQPTCCVYGMTEESLFGGKIPIGAAVGDQMGALFGQTCFKPGMTKCTYGTGGSLLMNTGLKPIPSQRGMLTTVAWGIDGRVEYALEGLLFVVGAAVQWLRDELQIIGSSEESEVCARKVSDTNGVYFVPAFVGLPAPYWDAYARGTIVGLTRGANRNHLVRATLESMAYQIKDVIGCMQKDSGISELEVRVDGGAARNDFLMQFQADLLGSPVMRPKIVEAAARGSAFLAGLSTGFWKDQDELVGTFELDRKFLPQMDAKRRQTLYAGWQKAVERSKDWEEHASAAT
jgi:glycerol kinase